MSETVEDNGEWSGSSSKDERIAGGYENVPTDDIHMTQIKFQAESLYILATYVRPLAEKVRTDLEVQPRSHYK